MAASQNCILSSTQIFLPVYIAPSSEQDKRPSIGARSNFKNGRSSPKIVLQCESGYGQKGREHSKPKSLARQWKTKIFSVCFLI